MILNLKILVISLSLASCIQNKQLNTENQYLVKIEKINSNTKIENLGYYLLKEKDKVDLLEKSSRKYNINSIISELIEEQNAIPVLDYPIKFWKQSCENKKLVFPENLESLSIKDSLELSRVYNDFTDSSNYSMIELNTAKSIKYKLFIGFAEIKNNDICLINWTHRISDTTAILGNEFRLKINCH